MRLRQIVAILASSAAALVTSAAATPGLTRSPAPDSYTYLVMFNATATGDAFVTDYAVPGSNPSYTGNMSASFSFKAPGRDLGAGRKAHVRRHPAVQ